MPMYTAACFDLDGTLIDTEPVHLQAETSCLAALGMGVSSLRHVRTFGKGIEEGMRSLAETYDLDYEKVLGTYMPLWESGLRQDLRVLPGAINVLSWLTEHGVPTALVTSGDRAYVDLVDSVLGLADRFIAVVTSDDVTNLKPAPDPYLKAAEGLATSPDMCVGFEDSGSGVASLNGAEMLSVAVHPDHDARPELQLAGVRVSSLAGVPPLLPAWFE
ncbi:HAD family hydrolase [Candidatus Latescibacterota bacterium]